MNALLSCLFVGLGASFGALTRFGVYQILISAPPFISTFVVNLFGSFLLGILWQGQQFKMVSSQLQLMAGIGFLGSFTTFSTFSKDNFELWQESKLLMAGNILGQISLGILGFYLGTLLCKSILVK